MRLSWYPSYSGNPRIFEGNIQPRALGLVMEWASQHQEELMNDWNLAKKNQPPKKISPLA
ncbi:MAG: DUF4160 domain-containing protein [Deltaproteobacteria bacterium]|nr:DUF4160 domain-containing protein [Deltaproteobacteria bacterium]